MSVKVEVFWLYPSLYTIAADADRYIALQYHTLLTCISVSSTHLLVEVELNEIPESHLFIYLSGWLCHYLALVSRQCVVVGPILECGCAVKVAIMTECCVRHQPILVLLEELLEGGGLHYLSTLLSIDGAQIVHLGVVHTLIVDLWQGIKRFLQRLILLAEFLVLQLWKLSQVGILRMQSVYADRIVWIRILPSVGYVGVVDRQYLQNALLGFVAPVNHHLEVAEVAYSETTFATQREDGDNRTCALPWINGEVSLRQFVYHNFAFSHLWQFNCAVHTVLPKRCYINLFVECYELKLKCAAQQVGVQTYYPLVVLVLNHVDCANSLPVA